MEENESLRFLLGVRIISVGSGLLIAAFNVLVKAGPRRLTAGELSAMRAWRLVLTPFPRLPLSCNERGVKNLLKDRGVTGGGFLGLRRNPASEAIEGGEEGISWDGEQKMGSDRGTSGRS